MLNLHRPISNFSAPLVPIRSSSFSAATMSSLGILHTYIAQERRRITGNICHVTTTHRCVTLPRIWNTQPPLLLRVGTCSFSLAMGIDVKVFKVLGPLNILKWSMK
jgi:hypothetical protein